MDTSNLRQAIATLTTLTTFTTLLVTISSPTLAASTLAASTLATPTLESLQVDKPQFLDRNLGETKVPIQKLRSKLHYQQHLAQFLPRPPDTGTPTGRPVPGTTRPEAACPATAKPLMAIVANNGKDFTLSAHPTFWFYIPYRAEQLKTIEFMLLNRNERETIYQTSIKLMDKPGLIKVALPNDSQFALAENQTYRWRLNLDCQPDRTLEPDLAIDGWVRRLPMNSQLENNHIWMDAIARAAEQHFANPTDVTSHRSWRQILHILNLSELAEEPLTNTELISVAE
jgi:hypothetical protein